MSLSPHVVRLGLAVNPWRIPVREVRTGRKFVRYDRFDTRGMRRSVGIHYNLVLVLTKPRQQLLHNWRQLRFLRLGNDSYGLRFVLGHVGEEIVQKSH